MDFTKFLELGYRYGSPVVYSGVFMFALYKLGVRVLDGYDRRETISGQLINTGMAGITAALQEVNKSQLLQLQMYERISKDVKDGFDRMLEANKYQRDEHKEIINLIVAGEKAAVDAREKIVNAVRENDCKAA